MPVVPLFYTSDAEEVLPAAPESTAPLTWAGMLASAAQVAVVTANAYLGGTLQAELWVTGGSVTADARRTKLRNGSLTIAAPTLTHTAAELQALLVTPGVEIAIQRGLIHPNGERLMADLGRFIVDEVTWAKAPADALTVTISDLSARVSRARWTDPCQIASGTALADALAELLTDRWSDVDTAFTCPEILGAQAVLESGPDSDPWADACKIAEAHGYALIFDARGVAVLRNLPDAVQGTPAFAFAPGVTAIVTERTTVSPLDRVYNGVIASGEGSGNETPVRGEAWDEDASSPTYRFGPFGQVPRFYSSPLITTTDQAESAATSLLAKSVGRIEKLSWAQVPHPGLEPLDVVSVEDSDGTIRRYIVDEVTIPLTASGVMTGVAREVTVSYQ